MVKKGKKSRESAAEVDHFDDAISLTSMDTLELAGNSWHGSQLDLDEGFMGVDDEDTVDSKIEEFAASVNLLTEKRAQLRENGLERCTDFLQKHCLEMWEEKIGFYEETLLDGTICCLRRKGAEGERAAGLLAVIFLTLHDLSENAWERSYQRLRYIVANADQPRDAGVRAKALIAIGAGLLTSCSSDPEDTEWLLQVCLAVLDTAPPHQVGVAAARCWGVLATTLAQPQEQLRLVTSSQPPLLPIISSMLRREDAGIRSSGGELAALIHEFWTAAEETTELNVVDALCMDTNQWDTICDLIKERATEHGKHMSKEAKKTQHALFRQWTRAIDSNEGPEQTVKFRDGRVEVSSWALFGRLQMLRICLRGGLGVHLKDNSRIENVLEDAMVREDELTDHTHAHWSKSSAASRAKSVVRGKDRQQRQAKKDTFLLADD